MTTSVHKAKPSPFPWAFAGGITSAAILLAAEIGGIFTHTPWWAFLILWFMALGTGQQQVETRRKAEAAAASDESIDSSRPELPKAAKIGRWVTLGAIIISPFFVAPELYDTPSRPKLVQASLAQNNLSVVQTNTPTSRPAVPMPADEQAYIQLASQVAAAYDTASNELQKSNTKISFEKSIFRLLPAGQVRGWVGTLTELHTNGDGDAYVEIEIAPDITMETSNNSFSDSLAEVNGRGHTLIPHGSALYQTVASLTVGDQVSFDARLLELDNLSEEGAAERPSMLARFSRIEPVIATRNTVNTVSGR